MLSEEDRETLEGLAKRHGFDERMELLEKYHAYTLEEATPERVLLRHGRYTLCEITVKRRRIHVDIQERGVCRFEYRGKDAIKAVLFLAESNPGYLEEKWTCGKNLAEPTEWLTSAAAYDVLDWLRSEAEDVEDEEDSVYLRADWSRVVEALAWEDFDNAAFAPFHCALSEIDWELVTCHLGYRPIDAFLHCLHAAREAKRQLATLI